MRRDLLDVDVAGASAAPGDELSVATVLVAVRRRWLVFSACVAGGVVAALGALSLQRPVFESVATLRVDAPSGAGLLGDLSRLVSLGASPAVEAEEVALSSRALAEATVAPGSAAARPANAARVDWTTRVEAGDLSLAATLRRRYLEEPTDRPYTVPAARLRARVEVEDPAAEPPARVGVTFLSAERLRLTTPSPLARLGLADTQPEERTLGADGVARYRGLALHLEPEGDVVGRSFLVRRLPSFEAVELLRRGTTVEETSRGSGVLRVTLRDTDPRRAQETLAALCDNYVRSTRERTRQNPDLTVEFVTDVLQQQERRFDEAQREIQAIQAESPESLALATVAEELVGQLAQLELRRVRIETAREALRGLRAGLEAGDLSALAALNAPGDPGVATPGLAVDPMTLAYVEELALLTSEAGRLAPLYEERHPDRVRLQQQIDALRARILAQLATRERSHDDELASVRRQTDDLRGGLDELPASAGRLARPLLAIETYKELLPFLLQSLQAAQISSTASEISPSFIDRPSLPTDMAGPNVARLVLAGLALGALAGALLATRRELRVGGVFTARDLAAVPHLPLLATIPRDARIADATHPTPREGPAAEAFRDLRAALDARLDDVPPLRTLGVCGAHAGLGVSTTALNLAAAFARHGDATLVVDADLRRPALRARLDAEPGPGLADVLERGAAWDAGLQATGVPKLDVLPAGQPTGPPGDLLTARALARILDLARERYERIVVDLPPDATASEVRAVARVLDATCLVARTGRSTRASLTRTSRRLEQVGARLRGVVLVEG